MKTGTHQVLSGVSSSTAGFNGTFLGPTMKWTNGDTVLLRPRPEANLQALRERLGL